MATDLERLVVQLSADVTQFRNEFRKAEGQANTSFRAIERRAQQMGSRLSSMGSNIGRGIAGAFAAAASAKGASSLVDSSVRVQNALKIAGLEGEELNKVYGQLFASAQKYSVPLEAISTLYGKMAMAGKELNATQEEMLQFTDLVGAALRVGGQSAEASAGALLQLSQAMGNGKIMAEEYNSIIEGARPLLQAVAAGLEEAGGSVAKLTQLVKSGQVSSEAFFRAGLAGAPVLAQAVMNSETTISGSMTRLQNVLIDAAKRFNESAQASKEFERIVSGVATYINTINFDNLVTNIGKVSTAIQDAMNKTQQWGATFGGMSGLDQIGVALEDLTGLPIATDEAKANAARKGFWQRKAEEDIKARNEAYAKVVKDPSLYGPQMPKAPDFKAPGELQTFGLPSELSGVKDIKRVSLDDYKVPATKKTGGKGSSKRDEFASEIEQLKERTVAMQAATAAQAALNPLVNDYGAAVEKARIVQELLTVATRDGKTVTDEQKASIEEAAQAYISAAVAADKLADKQDEIREKAQEAAEFNKSFARGIVDDFLSGADAADVFANALKRIGTQLLDMAFNDFFTPRNGGGGGGLGGLLAGLFTKGYASGGFTGYGARNQVKGAVHAGEVVVPKNIVDSMGKNNVMAAVGMAPGMPSKAAGGATPQFNYAPTINAQGADAAAIAQLSNEMQRDRANFESKVLRIYRSIPNRNFK